MSAIPYNTGFFAHLFFDRLVANQSEIGHHPTKQSHLTQSKKTNKKSTLHYAIKTAFHTLAANYALHAVSPHVPLYRMGKSRIH